MIPNDEWYCSVHPCNASQRRCPRTTCGLYSCAQMRLRSRILWEHVYTTALIIGAGRMPGRRGDRLTQRTAPIHKTRMRVTLLINILACLASASAIAQDRFGGSLAVTSDYVYRGVSLSHGRAAYQGGAHVKLGQSLHLGAWASTIENRMNDGTPIEAIYYLAYGWSATRDVQLRAAYSHYDYFGPQTAYSKPYDQVSLATTLYSRL